MQQSVIIGLTVAYRQSIAVSMSGSLARTVWEKKLVSLPKVKFRPHPKDHQPRDMHSLLDGKRLSMREARNGGLPLILDMEEREQYCTRRTSLMGLGVCSSDKQE